MAILSNDNRWIFISQGRCASRSIHDYFSGLGLDWWERAQGQLWWDQYHQHTPASKVRDSIGHEQYDSMLSFAVVRNPFEWVISSIRWHLRVKRIGIVEIRRMIEYYQTDEGRRYDTKSAIRTQRSFLSDDTWTVRVSRLLRHETLGLDFARVQEELGLPVVVLKRQGRIGGLETPWQREYRSQYMIDLVAETWADDIAWLGYERPEVYVK